MRGKASNVVKRAYNRKPVVIIPNIQESGVSVSDKEAYDTNINSSPIDNSIDTIELMRLYNLPSNKLLRELIEKLIKRLNETV